MYADFGVTTTRFAAIVYIHNLRNVTVLLRSTLILILLATDNNEKINGLKEAKCKG